MDKQPNKKDEPVQDEKSEKNEKPIQKNSAHEPEPRSARASPGFRSNAIITRRNCGVTHQFLDSIGGCSSNYR